MKLSLVITVYNKAHLLERALIRLERQCFPLDDLELVCLENWSEDWTDKLLRSWGTRLNITTIRPPYPRRQQDNIDLGLDFARGELVLIFPPEILVGDQTLNFLWEMQHTRYCQVKSAYFLTPKEQLHLDELDWEQDLACVHGVSQDQITCVIQNSDQRSLENPYFKPLKESAPV